MNVKFSVHIEIKKRKTPDKSPKELIFIKPPKTPQMLGCSKVSIGPYRISSVERFIPSRVSKSPKESRDIFISPLHSLSSFKYRVQSKSSSRIKSASKKTYLKFFPKNDYNGKNTQKNRFAKEDLSYLRIIKFSELNSRDSRT